MNLYQFIALFLVNSEACLSSPWNGYYGNWPSYQPIGNQVNSPYNPRPQYVPQAQQSLQQSANNKKPQQSQQQSTNNKPQHIPPVPQKPEQQSIGLKPNYSSEEIAQFTERASEIKKEETGQALTEAEKEELNKELSLIQDYSSLNIQEVSDGKLDDYNRLFGFGPLAAVGTSLFGSALGSFVSGGRGSSFGGGGGGNFFKTAGKAAAPIISGILSGESPKLGTYLNSIITLLSGL